MPNALIKEEQAKSLAKLNPNAPTILFAAGGTAGHVNPALAIARELMKLRPELQIVFTGNAEGIEHELVNKSEFEFYWIQSAPLPVKKNPATLFDAGRRMLRGYRQASKLINKLNVIGAVGAGGYATVPLILAAKNKKIKHYLHEQNAHAGKSTTSLAKDADIAFISYESTKASFSKAKRTVFSGNPVAEEFYELDKFEARKELGIRDDEFYILITGGSLGANTLNDASIELDEIFSKQENLPNYKIHLVSGKKTYDEYLARVDSDSDSIKISDYIYNMPVEMAASDIVICRAGAGTCAELQALGKPSVLVPYPYATADHQTKNAEVLEQAGAAKIIKDDELNAKELSQFLIDLMQDNDKLEDVQKNAESLPKLRSANIIAKEIIENLGDI